MATWMSSSQIFCESRFYAACGWFEPTWSVICDKDSTTFGGRAACNVPKIYNLFLFGAALPLSGGLYKKSSFFWMGPSMEQVLVPPLPLYSRIPQKSRFLWLRHCRSRQGRNQFVTPGTCGDWVSQTLHRDFISSLLLHVPFYFWRRIPITNFYRVCPFCSYLFNCVSYKLFRGEFEFIQLRLSGPLGTHTLELCYKAFSVFLANKLSSKAEMVCVI